MSAHTVVTTCTRDCPGCCGLIATAANDRLVSLQGSKTHPITQGAACAKTRSYVKRVHHPERVTTPLRRDGQGHWQPVSWDEAMTLCAARLAEALADHGPESIFYYQGFGSRTALTILNARFFALLGGATTLSGTLCGGIGYAAQNADMGVERISHDPLDHLNARHIVLWGRNPVATQTPLAAILSKAKRAGTKLTVVDPLACESSSLAQRHIRPKPGGDACLAMAVAKLALERGLTDEAFIKAHTSGFAELEATLAELSVQDLLAACDVPLDDALHLLAAYTQESPCASILGWGLCRYQNGDESARAVDALAALTGNLGISGGGVSQGFEEWGPYDPQAWGRHLHPPRRTVSMPTLAADMAAIRTDPAATPIKLLVVTSANPVASAPDSKAVAAEIAAVPFVVQMSHFLDDTSDVADLFLPCTSFIEEYDVVCGFGHNHIGPVNPVIAPVGQCRSQFHIFQDLAGRFAQTQSLLGTADEWLAKLLAPTVAKGLDLSELRRGPVRLPDMPMVPYKGGTFLHPDGRFHFLETFSRPHPVDPDYPLRLITPGSPSHLCSELTLSEQQDLVEAMVHPETAGRAGLAQGDEAWLVSALGRLRVRVATSEQMRADVVRVYRGGWMKTGHAANTLIPALRSKLGQGTAYYQATVRLEP